MNVSGEITVRSELSRALETLSKPELMVKCLPHLVTWRKVSDSELEATFTLNVGGVVDYLARLRAQARIVISRGEGSIIRYDIEGRAARAPYRGSINLFLEEKEPGLVGLRWNAELELSRLATLLGRFIDMDALIKRIVNDIVSNLEKCIKG
ncbi:MAG: hypothetical protein F7B17_03845 [Desulfurococcales archaeon]|nr:hypothetical protein [Desulfurococcales archaeon]